MEELKKLLKEKHSYYNKLKIKLDKELAQLPKGTVTKRKVYNQTYYYLTYRTGKKVNNKYISKEEPAKLIKQVDWRRQLEKELRGVKITLKMIRSVRPKVV